MAWPILIGNAFVFTTTCSDGNSLPTDLKEFLVIQCLKGQFWSHFDSLVDWNYAPSSVVNALLETVHNMTGCRIIWGHKEMKLTAKDHVKLTYCTFTAVQGLPLR